MHALLECTAGKEYLSFLHCVFIKQAVAGRAGEELPKSPFLGGTSVSSGLRQCTSIEKGPLLTETLGTMVMVLLT